MLRARAPHFKALVSAFNPSKLNSFKTVSLPLDPRRRSKGRRSRMDMLLFLKGLYSIHFLTPKPHLPLSSSLYSIPLFSNQSRHLAFYPSIIFTFLLLLFRARKNESISDPWCLQQSCLGPPSSDIRGNTCWRLLLRLILLPPIN